MNKRLFSKIMIGAITGTLTAISGIVTYGFVRLAQDSAKRDLAKRASEEDSYFEDEDGDNEQDHPGE